MRPRVCGMGDAPVSRRDAASLLTFNYECNRVWCQRLSSKMFSLFLIPDLSLQRLQTVEYHTLQVHRRVGDPRVAGYRRHSCAQRSQGRNVPRDCDHDCRTSCRPRCGKTPRQTRQSDMRTWRRRRWQSTPLLLVPCCTTQTRHRKKRSGPPRCRKNVVCQTSRTDKTGRFLQAACEWYKAKSPQTCV